MRLVTTLLTSNDIGKLERLCRSVQEVIQIQGVEWEVVVIVNSIHEGYYEKVEALNLPFKVVNTESNGKPGRGKNACLDYLLSTDFDYVSQIDGDDILYPSYLQSLYNHWRHYPSLDVLGVIPCELLQSEHNPSGHTFQVGEYYASIWGTSMCPPDSEQGPRVGHLFTEERPSSVDFIILQSRKSAQIKMNEDIGNGEDHAYTYKLLGEHIKGNIQYFLSMSSDLYCIDRTTEGSAQKVHNYHDYLTPMREEALKYVPYHRSNPYELPVIYKDLVMNHIQKEIWLKKFLS